MNIVICGLQGTGKTTLSKKISEKFGFTYINDYNICKSNVNDREILDFIKNNDNFVIDLCYSLNPKECARLKNCISFFFGFVSIDENLLYKLMLDKGENITLEKIKENKAKSKQFMDECKLLGIPFYDINEDRKKIIDKIIIEIKNKLQN